MKKQNKKILIFDNLFLLKKKLHTFKNIKQKNKILNLSLNNNNDLNNLITFSNISIADDYNIKIDNQDYFLKKYLHLISEIGQLNNTKYWWSSEMSSKNPLPQIYPFY